MRTVINGGPAYRLNCNLEELVLVEEGKPEKMKKNPLCKARSNNRLNPHVIASARESNPGHISGRRNNLANKIYDLPVATRSFPVFTGCFMSQKIF